MSVQTVTYFKAKPKLLAVLQMGGATECLFTAEQIVNFMGKYIEVKKLYDPQNKRIIHCQNDLLGEVFQQDEFIVGDFRTLWKFISPFLSIASKQEISPGETSSSKNGESSSSVAESQLPWWYFVDRGKNTDDTSISQTTGGNSYNQRETIGVRDTDYEESEIEFLEEYEPVDSDDSDATEPVSSDEDDMNEWQIAFIGQTQSDDDDDDGADYNIDSDIDVAEWWKCHECGTKNMPNVGYCMRCWKLRKGWASDQEPLKRSATEPVPSHGDVKPLNRSTSVDVMDGAGSTSQTTAANSKPSTSTITPSLPSFTSLKHKLDDESDDAELPSAKLKKTEDLKSPQVDSPASTSTSAANSSSTSDWPGLCNMCRNAPNDAVMVHGGTGHQFCCFKCAKRLRRRGKPCPICREPIMFIVKNFVIQF